MTIYEVGAVAGGRGGDSGVADDGFDGGNRAAIYDFGREPVRPKLAISLNGSNDTLRSEVIAAEPEVEPGGPE